MTEPEEILVERAKGGDRAAFEELVRRTSRLVYARLYLDSGDAHHAEDLLQETLLTAFRTISQLTQADRFRPWLLRIAHNALLDAVRYETRKKRTPTPQARAEPIRPEAHAEREELRQKVLAVLRELPEEYRLPVTLRYLVGADYETIQTQMGLSNGSLRGLLRRGMERLRADMQKALGNDFLSQ